MNPTRLPSPTQICERILTDEKRDLQERGICPSEVAIVDRMLCRTPELEKTYQELHGKLHVKQYALDELLRLVLSTSAYWSPEDIIEARNARKRLKNVNVQISAKAAELAGLLDERNELHNSSGFSTNTHYHIGKIIENAAQNNGFFRSWLKQPLKNLRSQYGLKYWPSLSEIVREIASDAERNSEIEANDPITAASTSAPRPSRADFVRGLLAEIEDRYVENGGQLPNGFKVSDDGIASLVNVVLDLEPERMTDAPYIKRLRPC